MSAILIMAGGTGGHVFPALAVANALRANNTKITWLGTRNGLEATVIPASKIDIEWITVEGLRGKGALAWVLAPFKLVRAIVQSIRAIQKVNPDCVLGMGGFVSGPGGLAAKLLSIPLIIHEQNAVAGLTNKYLAKIATRVLTGFPNPKGMNASAKWVGNPVRDSIEPSLPQEQGPINVLVIGGSQGAHSLNLCLPKLFAEQQVAINVWHQTGKGRSEGVIQQYQELGVSAKVTEFIDDMPSAYKWADLLICRAGAMTIAECCAAAKPALLIPYPFSAGDHQMINAQAMVDVGAGIVVSNDYLNQTQKLPELTQLLSDKTALHQMGLHALKLHKPNALNDVVKVCQEFLNA